MTQNNPSGVFSGLFQRRSKIRSIQDIMIEKPTLIDHELIENFERLDLIYRTLCGILYNFVPQSGHPGGCISSGRIVQALLFHTMDYDFSDPHLQEADVLSYAAGHKAMGLYAAWALRNECMRIAAPSILPSDKKQIRLEDLLGFRKNPVTNTPLFKKFNCKALDGHPTPATPFVKLSTGASGVGVASSFGLALGALDTYGNGNTPRVHVLEGEGGMTPGRVQEALAMAGTSQIHNLVFHLDWNQASIDSNKVCRDGNIPGDYVQWTPDELLFLNDWNVIQVQNGFDFKEIFAAQKSALETRNHQPTAIVYRTIKGWRYGIEGRTSHGAGHGFCSDGFYNYLTEFEKSFAVTFPRFSGDKTPDRVEENFWELLVVLRRVMEKERKTVESMAKGILSSRERLRTQKRTPRQDLPRLKTIFDENLVSSEKIPPELTLTPGQSEPLRTTLGNVVHYLNKISGGAVLGASADLLESTSISLMNKGFPTGFYNSITNPGSRLLSIGGICEDAMGGILSGISTYGNHIGIGSSYGAFIAALQHVAGRLHAIGQQTRLLTWGEPQNPFILVCAHAGPKTGEDGPTHADPQALQLLQENFPRGSMITLTPWDHQEVWPLMAAALQARPAVIAPFVTRPSDPVIDRSKYQLSDARDSVKGVYALRKLPIKHRGTIVLQGNGVATSFVTEVLPVLDQMGIELNIFYVASVELFDCLPAEEQREIFPEKFANEALGITEFTLPLLYRWVTSEKGRKHSLYPFKNGHFLGSGQGARVLEEGRLDGKNQLRAILDYMGGESSNLRPPKGLEKFKL